MATVREVAQTAGVSIATVSRVLNNSSVVTENVRAKVLEAINECGYVPSVTRRSTAFLGLVYACPFSLGSPYDVSLIEGMGRAMESVDLDLVLLNPQRDKQPDESYTQFFLRKGVRGVVLRSTLEGRDICRQIGEEKFPAIVLGDHFDDPSLAFSYADSSESSRQAIQHLITLGHRRIACAANEHEDGDHADRLTAYRNRGGYSARSVSHRLRRSRLPPLRTSMHDGRLPGRSAAGLRRIYGIGANHSIRRRLATRITRFSNLAGNQQYNGPTSYSPIPSSSRWNPRRSDRNDLQVGWGLIEQPMRNRPCGKKS